MMFGVHFHNMKNFQIINFKDREIFFNTLRHFTRISDVITERLNIDFYFDDVYYDDEKSGYILETTDGKSICKILIPWQFWDSSLEEIENILNKIPKELYKVEKRFFDLRELVRACK